MASTDDKLDALLGAVAQLTTVVGALAERVTLADSPGEGATTPLPLPEFNQDDGYAPLVPLDEADDGAMRRRYALVQRLGIGGTPGGQELMEHGARGFYRNLERDEGQERIQLPRDLARLLVEDAAIEDTQEAKDMGADLLKIWDTDEEDRFMARGGHVVAADRS